MLPIGSSTLADKLYRQVWNAVLKSGVTCANCDVLVRLEACYLISAVNSEYLCILKTMLNTTPPPNNHVTKCRKAGRETRRQSEWQMQEGMQ
jgi:hypothetical protein